MSYEEKTIECFDCGAAFAFSVQEQELFQTKGYTNAPKRCPACRQSRKERQSASVGYANKSFSNSGFNQRSPRQMFPATCAQCAKQTQVPFEPREGRPVYCSDCYNKVRVSR